MKREAVEYSSRRMPAAVMVKNNIRTIIFRLFRRADMIGVSEKAFNLLYFFSAVSMVILFFAILATLVTDALPALSAFGFSFLTGNTWDPVTGEFGAFPFLAGTLITSFLALAISMPFSISISIFLGEYFRKGAISSVFRSAIELLAGIPSVIYGFWGLFVLVPIVRELEMRFEIPPYGVGIFTAAFILAIMVIPYAASLGREVIQLVPSDLKEAAYSLGATQSEVIRKVILPHARSGIFAGILLALGRAVGETMAVTMVIGNANVLPKSIFDPANSMASIIANEFTEAVDTVHLASLIGIALFLFAVTTVMNVIGRIIIHRFDRVSRTS